MDLHTNLHPTCNVYRTNKNNREISDRYARIATYGSRRLRLRPLHPFVGLEATSATRTAATAQHTALNHPKKRKKILA